MSGSGVPVGIGISAGMDVKKTALRPFSFERTGGPPPSVFFAQKSLNCFGHLLLGNARFFLVMLTGWGYKNLFSRSMKTDIKESGSKRFVVQSLFTTTESVGKNI
jgi:hypothetical protein